MLRKLFAERSKTGRRTLSKTENGVGCGVGGRMGGEGGEGKVKIPLSVS